MLFYFATKIILGLEISAVPCHAKNAEVEIGINWGGGLTDVPPVAGSRLLSLAGRGVRVTVVSATFFFQLQLETLPPTRIRLLGLEVFFLIIFSHVLPFPAFVVADDRQNALGMLGGGKSPTLVNEVTPAATIGTPEWLLQKEDEILFSKTTIIFRKKLFVFPVSKSVFKHMYDNSCFKFKTVQQ